MEADVSAKYRNLIAEMEAKGLSLYAILRQNAAKNGKRFRLSFYRREVKEVVGIERERAEFARYLSRYGLALCTRCGGAGGAAQWPGWTCFDCAGRGYTN